MLYLTENHLFNFVEPRINLNGLNGKTTKFYHLNHFEDRLGFLRILAPFQFFQFGFNGPCPDGSSCHPLFGVLCNGCLPKSGGRSCGWSSRTHRWLWCQDAGTYRAENSGKANLPLRGRLRWEVLRFPLSGAATQVGILLVHNLRNTVWVSVDRSVKEDLQTVN